MSFTCNHYSFHYGTRILPVHFATLSWVSMSTPEDAEGESRQTPGLAWPDTTVITVGLLYYYYGGVSTHPPGMIPRKS